jgi:hypothetical protein
MDIENYQPLSFMDGQENLLAFYTEGNLFVNGERELTQKEKDAIAQAVLKEQTKARKLEQVANKLAKEQYEKIQS